MQNPPPSLHSEPSARHFSKDLHDLVATCLKKDKAARPTTAALLEHRFFRHMPRDRDHLRRHVLSGLPDVVKRVELMRSGKGPTSATECSEARALQVRSLHARSKRASGPGRRRCWGGSYADAATFSWQGIPARLELVMMMMMRRTCAAGAQ